MGERIKIFRESKGLTQTEFAKRLGFDRYNPIKDLETGVTLLKPPIARLIEHDFGVNSDWLLTGEGPMMKEEKGAEAPCQHAPESESSDSGHDDELSEAEALAMTRDVIRSKTVYRRALLSNIRAFHQAVTDEDKMRNTEEKVDLLITQVSRLTSAIEELQGKDQPEKKRAGNDY